MGPRGEHDAGGPSRWSPLKRHLLVLGAIVVFGVPVFALDWILLRPTGGGWASLDFRGILVGLYGAVALVFWIASGLVAFAIRPRPVGCLGYAGMAAATVTLLAGIAGAYYVVTDFTLSRELAAEEEVMLDETRAIAEDVVLEGWSIGDGEVVLRVRSTEARALCSWSVKGDIEEFLVGVRAEDDIDEYTCGTPGPHRTLPAGTSELRRPYQLEEGGTPDAVIGWRIELWIEGVTGMTRLIWGTDEAEETYAGEVHRRLPPPE